MFHLICGINIKLYCHCRCKNTKVNNYYNLQIIVQEQLWKAYCIWSANFYNNWLIKCSIKSKLILYILYFAYSKNMLKKKKNLTKIEGWNNKFKN